MLILWLFNISLKTYSTCSTCLALKTTLAKITWLGEEACLSRIAARCQTLPHSHPNFLFTDQSQEYKESLHKVNENSYKESIVTDC